MSNGRTIILFIASLLLAVGAAWSARLWVDHYTKLATTHPAETVEVMVAALEIPFGQRIESSHLKTLAWPRESVPADALQDPNEIVGRITTQAVYPGELIVRQRIRVHQGGSALSALINPSMRAVSVRVNDVSGVSGFLLPGNRVDVFSSFKVEEKTYTDLILQDIRVLAVDQEASFDKDKPQLVHAVTLETSPAQTRILTQAMTEGSIQLALRNPQDKSREETAAAIPRPRETKPSTHPVTLLKGATRFIVHCGPSECSNASSQDQ